MHSVYSFLLNHYQFVVLIGILPYIHLIRRYIVLRFGYLHFVRTGKGKAVVMCGKIVQPEMRDLYGRDGFSAGISALLFSTSSMIVPSLRTVQAVFIEIILITAAMILYISSAVYTSKQIHVMMDRIRNMAMQKVLEILEKQKHNQNEK